MHGVLRSSLPPILAVLAFALGTPSNSAQIRDGGIDPWNLGKGDWIYYMSAATHRLGGTISVVTSETSLRLCSKSQGARYIITTAAPTDTLFSYSCTPPPFSTHLTRS